MLGFNGFIFIRFIRAIRVRFNRRIVNQHYMELLNQPVAGFYEGLVVVVHHQLDDVATLATDEALVDVPHFVHVYRGVLVVDSYPIISPIQGHCFVCIHYS